jgi:hypothetical protein
MRADLRGGGGRGELIGVPGQSSPSAIRYYQGEQPTILGDELWRQVQSHLRFFGFLEIVSAIFLSFYGFQTQSIGKIWPGAPGPFHS